MAKQTTQPDGATTRKLTWRHVVGAVLLTVAAGVLALGWYISTRIIWTDGEDLLRDDDLAAIRSVLWTDPDPLEGRPNSPADEYEPSVAPTGDRILFVRGRPGENTDIFESRLRADGVWSQPLPITAINTDADELTPRVTADGEWLLFSSDRPGGQGAYDLWAAPRDEQSATGWGQPFNLGPSVNSPYNDYSPTLDPEGRRLYFTTDRDAAEAVDDKRPWQGTIRSAAIDDFDLYAADAVAPPATQPGEPARLAFADGVELEGINTPHREGAAAISPAGDFLYFVSNRPGGRGGFDIYRARLKDGSPTEVVSLGPEINTEANETDPDLAFDGFTLLFSSDRSGPDAGYDLFVARSREVYAERRGGMGWTWWVLASILALLALLFIGGFENKHLNVLQKAAIISLLIHLLLVLLFAVWDVTKEVVRYLGEDDGQMIVSTEAARVARMSEAARSQITPMEQSTPPPAPPTRRQTDFNPPPPTRRQLVSDTPRPANAPPLLDIEYTETEAPTPPEIVTPDVEPLPIEPTEVEFVDQPAEQPLDRVDIVEDRAPQRPNATIASERRDRPAPETARRESAVGEPAAAAPTETTLAVEDPVQPDPLSDAVAFADTPAVEPTDATQIAPTLDLDEPADTRRAAATAVPEAEVDAPDTPMLAAAGPTEFDAEVDAPSLEALMPDVDAADAEPSMPDLDLAPLPDAPVLAVAGDDIDLDVREFEADSSLLDPNSPAAARLQQRQAAQRQELLRERGGDDKTEDAVERALRYLASQQYPDGHWTKHDRNRPSNNATSKVDTALTGLSLLAFLGHGEKPDRLDQPYHDNLRRGLRWLLSVQGDNGDLRGGKGRAGTGHNDGNMYAHAIATIALAEAATVMELDMAQRDTYREAAIKAADYIVKAQLDDGGWRYAPSWEKNDRGDTSVVGWQVMALAAVSRPPMNYQVPDQVKAEAIGFLDGVATGEHKGLAAYQKGGDTRPAMAAEAAFCRILLGDPLEPEQLRELQDYLLDRKRRPGNGDGKEYYALYYSALALMQARLKYDDVNPRAWDQWNAAMKAWLPAQQRVGGDHDGSWEPNTRWAKQGGRIYSTSLSALTLQVYYRYDKIEKEGDGGGG